MSWFDRVVPPKVRSLLGKRDVPADLWIKDPTSGALVFKQDLERNLWVAPASGYHMKIAGRERLNGFLDDGRFEEIPISSLPDDPLHFRDTRRYRDRLTEARQKTGLHDAILPVVGKLQGHEIVAVVQDSQFMMGSLGRAAGSALVESFRVAAERHLPVVLFVSSGGARMQEGVFSLMQMARVTVAVQRHKEKGLPYVVVLTNPTTGGVTASYAMLGDVQIAEPGAMICFAGPRVIEATVREKLPPGFQTAEFLLERGMIDAVVSRGDLRNYIGRLTRILSNTSEPAPV